MKIDAMASESQYLSTLAPIWNALPASLRGQFIVADSLFPLAASYGIDAALWTGIHARTALVASARDLRFAGNTPTILCEHGAGQSYGADPRCATHPGYAGGDGRDNVILFLCPGKHAAHRNRVRYPDTPCVEIGDPRLDRLRALPIREHPPTIAVAFHWAAQVCPESGSAFYHWADHLESLLEHHRVLGTGHPRAFVELAGWYEQHGIIPVADFDLIVREADILIADNTSVMYQWAALDRPVVALNCPEYRRNIKHGLRFWEAIPGPQADDPADLPGALERADDKASKRLRAHAAREAFTFPEGAAERAVEAIEAVCDA